MRNYIKELAERIANTKGVIQILTLNADFLKGLLKDIGDLSEEAIKLSIANSRLKERVERLESTNRQQARDLLEFSAMVDTRSAIIDKLTIEIDSLEQIKKTQAATIEGCCVEAEKLKVRINQEVGLNNDTYARLSALRRMNENQRGTITALMQYQQSQSQQPQPNLTESEADIKVEKIPVKDPANAPAKQKFKPVANEFYGTPNEGLYDMFVETLGDSLTGNSSGWFMLKGGKLKSLFDASAGMMRMHNNLHIDHQKALNAISSLEDSNRTLLDRNAGLTKHNHELSNLKTPEPDQLLVSVLKQRDEAQKQLGEVNRRASLLGSMNDALKEDLNDRNARVEELRIKIGDAHKEIVKLKSKVSGRNIAINKLVNRLIEDSSD